MNNLKKKKILKDNSTTTTYLPNLNLNNITIENNNDKEVITENISPEKSINTYKDELNI